MSAEESWYVPIPDRRRPSAWRCVLSCGHEAIWHTSARESDAPDVLWCVVCHLARAVDERDPQPHLEYGACPLGHELVITATALARGGTVLCGDCWWAAHPNSILPGGRR